MANEWYRAVKENLDSAGSNAILINDVMESEYIPSEFDRDMRDGMDEIAEGLFHDIPSAITCVCDKGTDFAEYSDIAASIHEYSDAELEELDVALDRVLEGIYNMSEGIIWNHEDWTEPIDSYADELEENIKELRRLFNFAV